jgi:hypothetical protein
MHFSGVLYLNSYVVLPKLIVLSSSKFLALTEEKIN